MNIQDIDRFGQDKLASFDIPAAVQDRRAYLKFVASKKGSLDNLSDPSLVSEFSKGAAAPGTIRSDAASGASSTITVNPSTNAPVRMDQSAPAGVPLPDVRFPVSRSEARRVASGSQIQAGSVAPATPNIINPRDNLGVNPTALQMRSISLAGTGAAEKNPYSSDPALVGSAARKLNAGISNSAAYATMTPEEHAAIEPFLRESIGGRAFLSRRNSKLAQEESRLKAELNNPAKPITTIDEFNNVLQTADPIVRSIVLSKANEYVPPSLQARLTVQQASEIRDEELLKRNTPYFLAAAGDERFGVTEDDVRSYIANPTSDEAQSFFAAYLSDDSRPKYVAGEDGIRFIQGQPERQQRFRSLGARFDVTSSSDQKVLMSAGAKKSDIDVQTYEFKAYTEDDVPSGIAKASKRGATTGKIAATGVDEMVRSAQQRIEEGANPDKAVDAAMAEAAKSERVIFGNKDDYISIRSDVVGELKKRAEKSIQVSADKVRQQDAAVLAGSLESMAKKSSENGPMEVNKEKFPDLSAPNEESLRAASRFLSDYQSAGYQSVDDYIISRMGADPNGPLANYIRDAAHIDGAERAAMFPEVDAVITRVQNNLQAGYQYAARINQQRQEEAVKVADKKAQEDAVEYKSFREENPSSPLTQEQFKSQTIKMASGGYKQFVSPELKTIYESGDEDTKKFVDQVFPASPDGRVGGNVNPAILQTYTSAIRGSYQELKSKNLFVPVASKGGTIEFRETPAPLLTDLGVNQMNTSLDASSGQLQKAIADAAGSKGGFEMLRSTPQAKVSIPKELSDVMTEGSAWQAMYARGIEEAVKTGDRRKAEAAYLGARAQKMSSLAQRTAQTITDSNSALVDLASVLKIKVTDTVRASPDALGKAIGDRVDQIIADGFVDPSEYSSPPGDALDKAIGMLKTQRDVIKSNIDELQKIGAEGISFTRGEDGSVVGIRKAEVADIDRVIRHYSELAAKIGSNFGDGGLIQTPEGIPQDMRQEVERRFSNPSSRDPNWRAVSQQDAWKRAIDSVLSDVGLGTIGRLAIGDKPSAVRAMANRAGITKEQAEAALERRYKEFLPSSEAFYRVYIANKMLGNRAGAQRADREAAASEEERKVMREKLLGVNS